MTKEMNINVYKDIVDEIVNYEFQKMFYSRYENSKLGFYSGSLQRCLNEVVDKRKPLIFLFHNDEREADEYCRSLSDLEDFINENFLVLGWKLTSNNIDYCELLSEKIIIVDEVLQYLEEKKSAIFIITPNEYSVRVFKCIDYISTDTVDNQQNDDLFSELKRAAKLINSTKINLRSMTSATYQQWMYDELGDRDYDSFEPDEMDLLKTKILYSLFGPPQELKDKSIGYEEEQNKQAKELLEKIRETSNEYSKWKDRIVIAFIYVCIEPLPDDKEKKKKEDPNYIPEHDFNPIPVFVIRKCKFSKKRENQTGKRCRIVIDNSGRVYADWQKYLIKNKLPPCKMVYPRNGRYRNEGDEVILDEINSPNCSVKSKIIRNVDIGSTAMGLGSGVVLIGSMFTPLGILTIPAVVTGVATGIYSAARSGYSLYDRSSHHEDISLLNSESRGAYLSIVAGVCGVATAGITNVASTLIRNGRNIGETGERVLTLINSLNVLLSGTAAVNSVYDAYEQYRLDESVSALTLVQLTSSLFFFGNSIYTFRTGTTMVREMQNNNLNEIEASLRSNRHRKTFNKMLKETIRVRGEARGKAEVISTMRNSGASRDDILAVLTRSNKNFNKQGVRFAAEKGGITLNGQRVDILAYGSNSRTQQAAHLEILPDIPRSHPQANIRRTEALVENMQIDGNRNICLGVKSLVGTTISILANFEDNTQSKIIQICQEVINTIDLDCIIDLRRIFREYTRMGIIQFCIKFIYQLKHSFEERLLSGEDKAKVRTDFGFKDSHVTINDFVNYVYNGIVRGRVLIDELMHHLNYWYISLMQEEQNNNSRKKQDIKEYAE